MYIPERHLSLPRTRSLLALFVSFILAFTLLPAGSASAATVEHVVNGSFVTGTSGWKTNNPGKHPLTVSAAGRGGSNAAVITPNDSTTIVLNDAIDSVRGAKKGENYTLTAWVRSDDSTAVSAVKAREGGTNGTVQTHSAQVALKGTAWQKITLDFTTVGEARWIDINVLFWSVDAGKKVYVDSVSLTSNVTAGNVAPPTTAPSTPPTTAPSTPPTTAPSTPTPGKCSRVEPTGTSFGTSITTSGQTHQQAVDNIDSLFGPVPIIRVFDGGMPFPWSHRRTEMIAGRDLIMSFRPMPQDVLSGKHDAELRAWFEQAPSEVTIYWSYIHEPEPLIDQGKFTADQYRRAWQHVNAIADSACRTNMYPTLILTGWTTQSASKRNWRDYYPGDSVIEVMAFDPYNGVHEPDRDYYASPASMFDSVRKVADEAGKPYAIAETGSRRIPSDKNGTVRAAWLTALAKYHRDNNAVFVTYFQSTRDGEWRLLQAPETTAWAAAIKSSK